MTQQDSKSGERFVKAYERMMERVHKALPRPGQPPGERAYLHGQIDRARDKAVELGELSREEANHVADYLRRDIEDASKFLASSGGELSSWLKFDLQLIEDRLLEMLTSVADRTKIELTELEDQAIQASTYHTGEVTGPGTLACETCGKSMQFRKISRIPPCPHCHNTTFLRLTDEDTAQ